MKKREDYLKNAKRRKLEKEKVSLTFSDRLKGRRYKESERGQLNGSLLGKQSRHGSRQNLDVQPLKEGEGAKKSHFNFNFQSLKESGF